MSQTARVGQALRLCSLAGAWRAKKNDEHGVEVLRRE
jgi:hypothetical protein